jgi:hypothetical protein
MDSFRNLNDALEFLSDKDPTSLIAEHKHNAPSFVSFTNHQVQIGDLTFQKSLQIKKIKKIIQDRLDKTGNRKDLILKYGYDVKFASHLIRLLFEARELLLTGKIEFPLKEREILLEIKNGIWKLDQILKHSEQLETQITNLYFTSSLPTYPDMNKINLLCVDIVKNFLIKEGKL